MLRNALVAVLLGLISSGASAASSVAYTKVRVGHVVAHTVTVNLADPDVRVSVALAKGGTGSSESFRSIVDRTRPVAAVTGTFYDTKTLMPIGDIALFGTLVHSGCLGSALCVDTDNKPSIVPLRTGRSNSWTGYETVLCAGPTLAANGKVAIALRHEGFSESLLAPAKRTAVGITKPGKLLLVAVNTRVSLYNLAKLMLKLNVTDALCLDGGSSTAFYSAGRYYAVPSRVMTNCLVVYASVDDYNQARAALAPAGVLPQAGSVRQPAAADSRTASITRALATASAYGSSSGEPRPRTQSAK